MQEKRLCGRRPARSGSGTSESAQRHAFRRAAKTTPGHGEGRTSPLVVAAKAAPAPTWSRRRPHQRPHGGGMQPQLSRGEGRTRARVVVAKAARYRDVIVCRRCHAAAGHPLLPPIVPCNFQSASTFRVPPLSCKCDSHVCIFAHEFGHMQAWDERRCIALPVSLQHVAGCAAWDLSWRKAFFGT